MAGEYDYLAGLYGPNKSLADLRREFYENPPSGTGDPGATGEVSSVNGKSGVVVLDKGDIGLPLASNTSDADKPISNATKTELDKKALAADVYTKGVADTRFIRTVNGNAPDGAGNVTVAGGGSGGVGGPVTTVQGRTGDVTVSKADLGLTNVNDTSDAAKPVSTAQQSALDLKVDKVAGKGLSTNDYTQTEKDKVAALAAPPVFTGTDWRAGTITTMGLFSPAALAYTMQAVLAAPLANGVPKGWHYYDSTLKKARINLGSATTPVWDDYGTTLDVVLLAPGDAAPTVAPDRNTLYFRKSA